MLWPGLKKLGKELNLKRTDSEVVGIIKNCFVKMYDGNSVKVLELYAPEIDDADKEAIIGILEQEQHKIKKYEWLEKGIRIIFPELFKPYSIEKIRNLLNELLAYFGDKYSAQKLGCQFCGGQKETDVYCIGTAPVFICDDCHKETEEKLNSENMEQQFVSGNYFSGFLGAFLFSILGILLTIIFFVFLDILAALSAVAYMYLGVKGYKMFKGKQSPFGVFIIIMTGLIMIAVGVFISYCIIILRGIGSIDIELLRYVLANPEVQRELIWNIVLSYIVSALFVFSQLAKMAKEWKTNKAIHKAKEI